MEIRQEIWPVDFSSDEVHIYSYDDHCHTPQIVLMRANSCIGGTGYNALRNTNEDFCRWCKSGKHTYLCINETVLSCDVHAADDGYEVLIENENDTEERDVVCDTGDMYGVSDNEVIHGENGKLHIVSDIRDIHNLSSCGDMHSESGDGEKDNADIRDFPDIGDIQDKADNQRDVFQADVINSKYVTQSEDQEQPQEQTGVTNQNHGINQEVTNPEEDTNQDYGINQEVTNPEEDTNQDYGINQEVTNHGINQEVTNPEEDTNQDYGINQEVTNPEENTNQEYGINQEVTNPEEDTNQNHGINQEVTNPEEDTNQDYGINQEVTNPEEDTNQDVRNQEYAINGLVPNQKLACDQASPIEQDCVSNKVDDTVGDTYQDGYTRYETGSATPEQVADDTPCQQDTHVVTYQDGFAHDETGNATPEQVADDTSYQHDNREDIGGDIYRESDTVRTTAHASDTGEDATYLKEIHGRIYLEGDAGDLYHVPVSSLDVINQGAHISWKKRYHSTAYPVPSWRHGIVIDIDQKVADVIGYSENNHVIAVIMFTCFDLTDHDVRHHVYERCHMPDDVINSAKSYIGVPIFRDTCHLFARWCKLGIPSDSDAVNKEVIRASPRTPSVIDEDVDITKDVGHVGTRSVATVVARTVATGTKVETAKHAPRMLIRGASKGVAAAAAVGVEAGLLAVDISLTYRSFNRREISKDELKRQHIQNTVRSTCAAAASLGGGIKGATIGSFFLPGLGTAVGGMVGGVVGGISGHIGGTFAGKGVASVVCRPYENHFVETDVEIMEDG